MNKVKTLLYAVLLGLAMSPQLCHAQGTLIWTGTFGESFGNNAILSNRAEFQFSVYSSMADRSYPTLFSQITFGTQDVGSTFTIASPADDTNFNFMVTKLTDGTNELFNFLMAGFNGNSSTGAGRTTSESGIFAGTGTGPDLIGYHIQSFGLHIDSLTIQSPGSDPNHNGNWTDFRGQVTLNIYGSAVPEPSFSLLILLGSGILIYARRICKKGQPCEIF